MENYGGKHQDKNTLVKYFNYGSSNTFWRPIYYENKQVITASQDIYIQGNLYIDGSIITPSDERLKYNISAINNETTDKIMNLQPVSFMFRKDNTPHYGFIAQEFENEYPSLVKNKVDEEYVDIKAINYLEIIPLLVSKLQNMQKEINDLQAKLQEVNI
jgi:hypothetical protein